MDTMGAQRRGPGQSWVQGWFPRGSEVKNCGELGELPQEVTEIHQEAQGHPWRQVSPNNH